MPLNFLIATSALLWAIFFIGRVFGHRGTGALATVSEFMGMIWMGTLLLLFISLLTAGMITLLGFLLPRLAPLIRTWALVAGILLSIIALVQGMRPAVVQNYEVRLADLPLR